MTGTSWPLGAPSALPADRPRRPSRPTAGLVVVLRAVFGSRLIPQRSFKNIFSIKKPMKRATGAKA